MADDPKPGAPVPPAAKAAPAHAAEPPKAAPPAGPADPAPPADKAPPAFIARLEAAFPGMPVQVSYWVGDWTIIVPAERILAVAKSLREMPETSFDMCSDLTGRTGRHARRASTSSTACIRCGTVTGCA